MSRFYAPPPAWRGSEVTLSAEEAHHARDVLRLKVGDTATIFDGAGRSALGTFSQLGKQAATLSTTEIQQAQAPGSRILLAQAIPKGKSFEWIIEKAVELGAAGIIPLLTDRTIVRIDPAESEQKREKWQRVAIEACKQCGQNWLPIVSAPQKLTTCLEANRETFSIVAALTPGAQSLKTTLQAHSGECIAYVGPEGDFTPAELAAMLGAGCKPVTLGQIVLRSETAALYCLSILAHTLRSD
jgi:16S rRNA (uracil1498-N3)-methyltransferase